MTGEGALIGWSTERVEAARLYGRVEMSGVELYSEMAENHLRLAGRTTEPQGLLMMGLGWMNLFSTF
jgi:hypothetical protein